MIICNDNSPHPVQHRWCSGSQQRREANSKPFAAPCHKPGPVIAPVIQHTLDWTCPIRPAGLA